MLGGGGGGVFIRLFVCGLGCFGLGFRAFKSLGFWGFLQRLGLRINQLLQFPTTIGVQVLGVLALRISGLGRFLE